MKTSIVLLSGLIVTALLHGCNFSDSQDDSASDSVLPIESNTERPAGSRPASSSSVDVFSDFVVLDRRVPDSRQGASNFLSNAGFENGLEGWVGCQSDAIGLSGDAYAGTRALSLSPGRCMFRSVQAVAGENYALSCFVKLTNIRAWTGMGMNFSNENFQSLLEAPVAVATSGEYARLTSVGRAPLGTDFVSMFVHSDHGALIDNCSLSLAADLQLETQTNPANLLENADFRNTDTTGGVIDWIPGCNGQIVGDGSSLFLSDGVCVDQALGAEDLDVIAAQPVNFNCLVSDVEGYSDMSVFVDQELLAVTEISSDQINTRVSLQLDPVRASNGFVSLFSEGHLRVEDCVFGNPNIANPVDETAIEQMPAAEQSARYRLTFNATWSQQTHAINFPSNAHFSPLVGAVHNDAIAIWGSGSLASPGIKQMAETGDGSTLLAELEIAVGNGLASSTVFGGGVPASPGSVSVEFEVTRQFPLLTLTSMVAPSPDWFVGVRGLSLVEGNDFVDNLSVDLRVYDAGTDSADQFTSADFATQPPELIQLLTTDPSDTSFIAGRPDMGQFVIERLP